MKANTITSGVVHRSEAPPPTGRKMRRAEQALRKRQLRRAARAAARAARLKAQTPKGG